MERKSIAIKQMRWKKKYYYAMFFRKSGSTILFTPLEFFDRTQQTINSFLPMIIKMKTARIVFHVVQ